MFSFVSVWLVWDSEECVCWGEYQNRLTDSQLHAMKECAPLKALRPWNKNTKLTKNQEDKNFFLFCPTLALQAFEPSFRKFSTKSVFFKWQQCKQCSHFIQQNITQNFKYPRNRSQYSESVHGRVNFLHQTQIFFGMIDDKEAWRFDFRLRRQ